MKPRPLHLLPAGLFALAAPLVFYVLNPDNRIYVAPLSSLRAVAACALLAAVFFGLAFALTRRVDAAGLIATVLVLGALYLWQVALAVLLAVGVFLLLLRLARRRIDLNRILLALLFLAATLAGWYGVRLATYVQKLPARAAGQGLAPVGAAVTGGAGRAARPDIYYLVLDGYARADVLARLYGYDNTPFLDQLRELGFVVSTEARANYGQTVLSLGSSLNMQYLDGLTPVMGDTPVWWPLEESLHHSQVRSALEGLGYRTIFTASDFDYTDITDADLYVQPFPVMLNNFEDGFVRFTSLSLLQGLEGVVDYPSYETHRRVLEADFEALGEIASLDGPKFVFAHILAPHPPFVFDEQGRPVDPATPFTLVDKMRQIMDASAYQAGYVAELRYVNERLLESLRSILANEDVPPVILIQADHGPGLYLDAEQSAATCLFERYSILAAYLLPGLEAQDLPENYSPVNAFRMVFNAYFSAGLPYLPERSYFSPSSHIYNFQDVTDQVGMDCPASSLP